MEFLHLQVHPLLVCADLAFVQSGIILTDDFIVTAYDAVHQAHRKLAAVLFGSEDMDCMTWSLDNRPS